MKSSENVDSFVTPMDIVRFNRAQLKRAIVNLSNAQKRKDEKAVVNIQRKILLYESTISIVEQYKTKT